MNHSTTCIFCSIISRTAPAEIVFENDHAVAFLDIRPIHPGHTLVVPKTHYDRTIDIPDDELYDVMKAINVVAQSIVDILRPDGYNMFTSNGRAAGQSVFHVHFHVTPRYYHDNIAFRLSLKTYKQGEMKLIADQLREEIINKTADEHG